METKGAYKRMEHKPQIRNVAYIDNQNLYRASTNNPQPWDVDMRRLRVYLRDKYKVQTAYLFMGCYSRHSERMYDYFKSCGYELMWRPHNEGGHSLKKGNVDTDIVFKMMLDLYEGRDFDLMYLVSGDGDYFMTVDHMLEKGCFGRVLFPSRRNASFLYKGIPESNKAYLDTKEMRRKIGKKS